MAEEETPQEEENEQDPLELLEARARGQLNFVFAAAVTTVLLMVALGFTYLSLSGRVLLATEEPLMEMTNLAGMVSEEYENLNLAVEFHNHLLDSITARLDAIEPSVDQSQFAELEEVLRAQEQDFQYFLETAKLAVNGLSQMVSGSRDWREEFNTRLDAAIATSRQRQLNLTDPDAGEAAEPPATDDSAPASSP